MGPSPWPVVYRWTDGWKVVGRPMESSLRWGIGVSGVPAVFVLRGLEMDDHWSVAVLPGGLAATWSAGRPGWQLPEYPKGTALVKMRTFLLELGVCRPSRGPLNTLVYCSPPGFAISGEIYELQELALPSPVWVSEEKWEKRYPSSVPADDVLSDFMGTGRTAHLWWRTHPFKTQPGRLSIFDPSTNYEKPVVCMDGLLSPHGYFEANSLRSLIDLVTETLQILPESQRLAWEEDHLDRGEFCLPSGPEVEIYRVLGTPLPWLWDADARTSWFEQAQSSQEAASS